MQTASHKTSHLTCFTLVISLFDISFGIAGLLLAWLGVWKNKNETAARRVYDTFIILKGLMGRSRAALLLRYGQMRPRGSASRFRPIFS